MLAVIKFIALSASVAVFHFSDGLGFVAFLAGSVIGLLAVRFYWILLPAAGLANLSNLIYAESTGPGKADGALGVFPVEFFVFLLFTAFAYGFGVWVREVLAWRLERLKSLGAGSEGAGEEISPAVAATALPQNQKSAEQKSAEQKPAAGEDAGR